MLIRLLCLFGALPMYLAAQESDAGFDLRATVSASAFYSHQLSAEPRSGAPTAAGFRAILYPVWKFSKHWSVSGALEGRSRPLLFEDFETQGYGLKADLLQAGINYSRFWKNGSILARAGLLSSAFGSFLLRYDDADNPLIDSPLSYGYYDKAVSSKPVTGVQVDATAGKVDMRAQFANSSPGNPRNILQKDQYGSWTAGIGYTIAQGFRVGASASRGPFLDHGDSLYFAGTSGPKGLPATALGIDLDWARGHWNLRGEWQRFQYDYATVPTSHRRAAYLEARRVLNPRWFVAGRAGELKPDGSAALQAYEAIVGFRPNSWQILKFGYEIQRGPGIRGSLNNVVELQVVTSLHPLSLARK